MKHVDPVVIMYYHHFNHLHLGHGAQKRGTFISKVVAVVCGYEFLSQGSQESGGFHRVGVYDWIFLSVAVGKLLSRRGESRRRATSRGRILLSGKSSSRLKRRYRQI